MTLDELKAAERAREKYERASRHSAALKGAHVSGILVASGSSEPIALAENRGGGGGTITGIGYPESLKAAMTSALHDWANAEINEAVVELRRYGIEVRIERPPNKTVG